MARRARNEYSCGVELALEVLGGKWKPVILAHLKERPLRYGELRRLIPALSEKMLTQRLRDLENLGLVKKRKSGRRGSPSIYRITARAESLRPALTALNDWGHAMAGEVGATIVPRW